MLRARIVVHLFVGHYTSGAPIRSLAGFRRIALNRGARKTVEFLLGPRELSSVSGDGRRAVEPGSFQIVIGGGQPVPNARNVLTKSILIEGPAKSVD